MAGFVSFVSSGPGDPDLLTLKAVDRLRRADAVLFDDLSSGPILTHAKAGADLIGVGKRAPASRNNRRSAVFCGLCPAGRSYCQAEIGDGGLFGRLEEELMPCGSRIDYEIIPGVPSAFAAAAAAGIPLTRRLTARRIQFVTGHDASGQLPEDVNLPALADPTATTVVFMGKRTFSQLQKQLQQHGLPPDTPALLAEAVSTPQQTLKRTTIGALADQLETEISASPALILYGPLAEGTPDDGQD